MDIGIIGVNFKSADLFFRERLVQTTLKKIHSQTTFSKVILSTCNRFEVYFSSTDLTKSQSELLKLFRQEFKKDCGFRLYSYFGSDCFVHLSRVTTGLDSAILVETEIQGQVKRAYLSAQKTNLSSELHFIFQKSLKIGKSLRSKFEIGRDAPNLIDTVGGLLENLRGVYQRPKILFVGTSQINTQIIQRIGRSFDVTISSRSQARAEQISKIYQTQILEWNKLSQWVDYDGLVFATNHPEPLIEKQSIENPKLILDLSVPRNVPPNLSDLEEIKLINIDQLNKLVRKHRRLDSKELSHFDSLVQNAVQRQCEIFRSKTLYLERCVV